NRNPRIIVEKSDGRFGSDFKLVAVQNESSHFIFMDLRQTKWLDGVLRVASGNEWRFPLVCECESQKRVISLTRFHMRGSPVVKVYERCRNGKIFFVLIPIDPNGGGWLSLLKALEEVVGDKIGSTARVRTLSYAQVVAKKDSPEGRCFRTQLDGMDVIRVADD
ncbi:hypothetical protein LINGRAHAP2_LOCUS31547, partial [Linum grandiflorum]